MRRWLRGRSVRAIGAPVLAVLALVLTTAAAKPVIGQPAPAFELTMMDGSKVSSDDLRGKVVVLNFWATWCVPCRQELPLLDRYYALQQKAGLRVFAVTTEDSAPLYQLKKLFAAMAIPSARKIHGPYAAMGAVPTSYIIDRAGRLRYAKAAAFDLDALNGTIVPLLNEPTPAAETH